jgi:hypothetical protein
LLQRAAHGSMNMLLLSKGCRLTGTASACCMITRLAGLLTAPAAAVVPAHRLYTQQPDLLRALHCTHSLQPGNTSHTARARCQAAACRHHACTTCQLPQSQGHCFSAQHSMMPRNPCKCMHDTHHHTHVAAADSRMGMYTWQQAPRQHMASIGLVW